jgi:anaerobic selenocysteine-containing dehydrogenase
MTTTDVRTVRSFCRICTAVCGILVDVSDDRVVRPRGRRGRGRPQQRGEMVGVAKVDPSIRRGVVSVPHGHQGANVNLLTDKDDIDLVTGMARYSGVPVSLRPQVRR